MKSFFLCIIFFAFTIIEVSGQDEYSYLPINNQNTDINQRVNSLVVNVFVEGFDTRIPVGITKNNLISKAKVYEGEVVNASINYTYAGDYVFTYDLIGRLTKFEVVSPSTTFLSVEISYFAGYAEYFSEQKKKGKITYSDNSISEIESFIFDSGTWLAHFHNKYSNIDNCENATLVSISSEGQPFNNMPITREYVQNSCLQSKRNTTEWHYNTQNMISGIDDVNFVLDTEGRIIKILDGDTLTFSYDNQNRLTDVVALDPLDHDSIYIEYANIQTAINEISVTELVRIFPNPSNSCFAILSETELPISSFEIYSIDGKRILYKEGGILNSNFCLNGFPDGYYFVVFRDVFGGIVGKTSKIQVQK